MTVYGGFRIFACSFINDWIMSNDIRHKDLTDDVRQAKLRFGIIGNAPALIAAVERAIRVAPIDLSVLVCGESGTGKEFFPQIIHAYSPRKHARYIAVNCGAIPAGTIDSELFGPEKGAFTGAVDSRKGYFEEADGGTIFLDEVAELPLTTQARLLRVLESGEFLKVGSSTVQRTNIRVVAATNVDMLRAVEEGRFREDLYYRLSTVQITIPPLRDRASDIRLLARKFASDFAERYHTPAVEFSEEAMALFYRYRWPGNVRQLKNVVEQMALFEAGTTISPAVFESYLPQITSTYMPVAGADPRHSYEREREMLFSMIFRLQERIDDLQTRLRDDSMEDVADEHQKGADPSRLLSSVPARIHPPVIFAASDASHVAADSHIVSSDTPEIIDNSYVEVPSSIEENERDLIRRALLRNGGRRKAAAAELKISERTLYRKIKEYELE